METKELIEKAERIAREAHKGQKRWGGEPYITHVEAVVDGVKGDAECIIVAWLHDVVEDTPVTLDVLRAEGFSDRIIHRVSALTRDKHLNYFEYIKYVACDRVTARVKLADLRHNMSTLKEGSMKDKYRFAKDYLKREWEL